MKYNKEELYQLIIVEKLSYTEVAKKYKVSDTTIRRNAIKLGIVLEKKKEV